MMVAIDAKTVPEGGFAISHKFASESWNIMGSTIRGVLGIVW
jgi:hypothetical protein